MLARLLICSVGIFYLPDFTKPVMIWNLVWRRRTPKHLVKIYWVKDNDSEREFDNRGVVIIMLAIVIAMMGMVTRVLSYS